MIDPRNNNNDNIKNVLDENEDINYENTNSISDNSNVDLKQKMRKLLLIIVLCVVILIIILLISSLLFPKNKKYSDIETIMKNAAIEYYSENKNTLPQNDKVTVEITADKLEELGYMRKLSKYRSKDTCSGKVSVYNNDGSFLYTPYLDCGDNYKTTELYKKVIESKNIVTTGSGLYNTNGEYVFKGDYVNNYVKINDNIWRIVKVDSNNELVLIYQESVSFSNVWDNRYNTEKKYKSGINKYDVSRINTRLQEIFKSNEESNNYEKKVGILNKETRKLAVSYKLCTAHRSTSATQKDNSIECSSYINGKIGLLTLSDYANASLDSNCDTPTKKSCQNYNYLVNKNISGWWLITAASENTSSVYYINQSGYAQLTDASNAKAIRPVIHLSSKAIFKSGKGTEEKPYTLKY